MSELGDGMEECSQIESEWIFEQAVVGHLWYIITWRVLASFEHGTADE